jgi:hypothetical protein
VVKRSLIVANCLMRSAALAGLSYWNSSSSIDGDRGAPSRPSSSQPSSGWTGSTIAGFWNPSASSRRPKPEERYFAMLNDPANLAGLAPIA